MHWASNRFLVLEGDAVVYAALVYTLAAALVVLGTRGRLGLGQQPGNAADFQTKF
jgi:hypothetical protein